ncbi:MAG: 50S ribosomal protein L44e [Thermoproteota archaeon]
MKIGKEMKAFCPRCNKHTSHSVSLLKTGKRRKLARGERHHDRVDRHGYGGQKAPLAKPVKTTKKMTIKLKCRECGYVLQREGVRLKKLEIA